ncbi:MAG TPA: hypothetical protein VNP20_12360 [Nocardioidaceae bacterium]|jgi:hypothetical protein|nr:hypothetical protein [Nocardioidaceae bacterium]
MSRLNLRRSGPWIGMAGLVTMLWLYGASALVAPPWAVAVLVVLWLVQFVLACRWFSRRPYVVLAMPVIAIVVWLSAIVAGDVLLGWTA